MKVTEVRMKIAGESRVRAYFSVALDDELSIHGLKLIDGKNGLFIAMPSRKDTKGIHKDICHPIESDFRDRLTKAAIDEYDKQKAAQ